MMFFNVNKAWLKRMIKLCNRTVIDLAPKHVTKDGGGVQAELMLCGDDSVAV